MPLCHTLAQKIPMETSKLPTLCIPCAQMWSVRCSRPCGQCAEKRCPVIHMDIRAISHLLVKPVLSLYSLDDYSRVSCCMLISFSHAVCIALHDKAGHVSHHTIHCCHVVLALQHLTFFVSCLQIMSCITQLQPVIGSVRLVLGIKSPICMCNRYWNTLPQFISHIGKVTTTVTSSSGASETCLSNSSSSAANETYADPLANIGASSATSTAVMSVSGLIGALLLCMLLL